MAHNRSSSGLIQLLLDSNADQKCYGVVEISVTIFLSPGKTAKRHYFRQTQYNICRPSSHIFTGEYNVIVWLPTSLWVVILLPYDGSIFHGVDYCLWRLPWQRQLCRLRLQLDTVEDRGGQHVTSPPHVEHKWCRQIKRMNFFSMFAFLNWVHCIKGNIGCIVSTVETWRFCGGRRRRSERAQLYIVQSVRENVLFCASALILLSNGFLELSVTERMHIFYDVLINYVTC